MKVETFWKVLEILGILILKAHFFLIKMSPKKARGEKKSFVFIPLRPPHFHVEITCLCFHSVFLITFKTQCIANKQSCDRSTDKGNSKEIGSFPRLRSSYIEEENIDFLQVIKNPLIDRWSTFLSAFIKALTKCENWFAKERLRLRNYLWFLNTAGG